MVNLLQIKLWEILQKTGRKNVSKILKNTRKEQNIYEIVDLALLTLSKTPLYGWFQNKWLLPNSNIASLMFDLCLYKDKVHCAVKLLSAVENNLMVNIRKKKRFFFRP